MKGGISIAEVDFAAFEIGVFPINSEWPASATVSLTLATVICPGVRAGVRQHELPCGTSP